MTDNEQDAVLRLEQEALWRFLKDLTTPPIDPYVTPFPIYPGGGLNSVKGPTPEEKP